MYTSHFDFIRCGYHVKKLIKCPFKLPINFLSVLIVSSQRFLWTLSYLGRSDESQIENFKESKRF